MSVASSRRADIIANSARRAVKRGIVGQRVLFNRHADLIMRPLVYEIPLRIDRFDHRAHLAPQVMHKVIARSTQKRTEHLLGIICPRAPSKDQCVSRGARYVASLLLLGPVSVRQPVRVELGAEAVASIDDPLAKVQPPHDIALTAGDHPCSPPPDIGMGAASLTSWTFSTFWPMASAVAVAWSRCLSLENRSRNSSPSDI